MSAQLATQPSGISKGGPAEQISHAKFVQRLQQMQQWVRACRESPNACDISIGSDEDVSAEGNESAFSEHWDWLRDAFAGAHKAKPADRIAAMDSAGEHLAELLAEVQGKAATRSQVDPQRARDAAVRVLARSEFRRVKPAEPTWWDRKMYQFRSWVNSLVEGAGRLGAAAPWLGKLLEWTFFIAAAAGLLLFVRRSFARQQLRIAMNPAAAQFTVWDREANDWASEAEACAGNGEWREAVHCLYWAAIVRLEAGRAWRHNPARTPREYVRLLQTGSAQQGALRGLTSIFERVWYGLRDAEPADYERAKNLFAALGSNAEMNSHGASAL